MLCASCTVDGHWAMPFHKVEEWTGTYFKRTTLANLGLVIQLGHRLGQKCVLPAIVKSFVVIDVDGIHTVQMGFCNCTQSIEQQVQLLRSRLWPTTTIYPQTAATFHVLHLFQVLSFMSKVSAYEFYHTLACLSDNTGLYTPPDRYDTFLWIMCEWHHLCSLKRFSRGHEPGGIAETRPGELVLCCPACPHPHVNLPRGWNENLGKHWLYRLFLAVDANFQLCCLNVSNEDNDPSLNRGYGYFVKENSFWLFLEMYGKIILAEEKSTCNNHDAVKLANSHGGQEVAATGVGAVVCGRHDMKCPLSVGDLQKGERYINMDYFVLSTLTCDMPPDLVISYNIACQWHKNLFVRISKYPMDLQPGQLEHNILYLVPKFHLLAHILKCRNNFSFNFSAKRTWAATNALANSTKEMGPGSRQDTHDDHFGDYNWRKIVIMAQTLCEKFRDAFKARVEHVAEFISYEDALQSKHADAIIQWCSMVLTWEQDCSQPNPFAPTLHLCLELVREEKQETKIEIHHDVSPSEFIAQGLQLEEAQVQQQANCISRKIEAWIDVQKVYMPRTTLLCARDDDRRAPGVERRLRLAQAHDTLATLHDHLLLKSFSHGQCYGTKANVLMHRVETKIQADAACYRQVYMALEAVSTALGQKEWKAGLSPLKAEDVHGLDSYNETTSEGQPLHIEWCKSCMHAQRWQEECDLLTEEICWVQVTFQYYSGMWKGRATCTDLPGAKAYALRQATLWSDLSASAATRWNEVLASLPAPSVDFDPTMDLDLHGHRS
ncbi:uncharacterized protein EV420DRAFT_1734532 [Desarmillaria tabescens]|uniref:CxC2-like cysteine cluster KDZ transposase-associated domain-containing protein n=1 Tax=Armillaria tabescens TaxID=1929756 RepID=A0AA39NB14_ARMTA|nr:uncharacterized protein EV420DRAFT_1734532 [Desarmillaria tabescens]KAK0462322.1 hypothetical protein EV420DRAFT_1734532 [Desarmillaria tabescens]